MEVSVPSLAELLLLALAAYRVWRLVAEDDILDRPRRRLLRLGEWRKEGDPVPANYRSWWGDLLRCAWCAGFWISVLWWLAWAITPDWTLFLAVPFAVSALVGFARVRLDPDED